MRLMIVNSNRERSPWPVPPVGACSIASAAADAGHDVRFVDLCFSSRPEKQLRRQIRDFAPHLIGISIRNIDNVDWQAPHFYLPEIRREVVEPCKQAGCPVVVGGPAAGIMAEEILDYLGVDFAISGDGELAIVQLLEALQNGTLLAHVQGLTYRLRGAVCVNEPARIDELDELPFTRAHEWVDVARYASLNGALGIQTKRGCEEKCTYCTYNQIEGRRYRCKSPERIADEVERAVRAGAKRIEFVDSTFNVPLDHAMGVCRELVHRQVRAEFSTMGINPKNATSELFELLKAAGFTEVSLTPESASPPILKALGKGFTIEDILRSANVARRCDLPVLWYFMFGAPGETEETVAQTLRFIDENIPETHLVQLVSGIRIFKGAPIERVARREGQLSPTDSLLEPVWYRPPIEHSRLCRILDDAMARHPNWIGLQDNNVPGPLLRAVSALHRLSRSRKPLWRYLRYLRRITNALGLPPHLLAGRSSPVAGSS